jgi:hypothetical protein
MTFALDASWDIYLDGAGNIALAYGPEATAQNAANECRLFTRDAYFRQAEGVPHWISELGAKAPAGPLLKALMRRAALRVPDVREVTGIEAESFDRETRALTGNLWFVTRGGERVGLEI